LCQDFVKLHKANTGEKCQFSAAVKYWNNTGKRGHDFNKEKSRYGFPKLNPIVSATYACYCENRVTQEIISERI